MKRFPKLISCDKRGQLVIPKEVREELGLDRDTAFLLYTISDQGILLKKVPLQEIERKLVKQLVVP